MEFKKILLFLVFTMTLAYVSGQNSQRKSYIVLKTNDTIFTKKLNYNWKDKIGFLTYKDINRKIQHVADSLVLFYFSNSIKHVIAYNEVLKQKFICRELSPGKISVYEVVNNGFKPEFYITSDTFNGFIDETNFHSTLIPVLDACPNFKHMIVRDRSFLLMQHYIRYYNKNCE